MKNYKQKIKEIVKDDSRKKKKKHEEQKEQEEKEYKGKLLEKFSEMASLLEEIKEKNIKIPEFPKEIEVKNFPEQLKEIKVTNFPEQKEFPKEMTVKNFSELKKFFEKINVYVKNFPNQPEQKDFPKKIDVDVKNFPKQKEQKEFPKEIKVSNIKEIEIPKYPKEIEVKEPKWWQKWLNKQDNEGLLARFSKRLLSGIGEILNEHGDPDKAFAVKLVTTDNQFYHVIAQAVAGGGYEIVGIKDSGNNRIDPAHNNLTQYKVTDKDDDASPNYYGFTDKDGNWYILKETVSAGADTYRYASGLSGYTTNWTNRATLSYDYFYNVF